MIPLEDASVLVAGATGGLGAAITAELEARGASLTLTGRDPAKLAEVATPRAATVAADLRDDQGVQLVVDTALRAHGRLDGVIFAAGCVAFGPMVETSPLVVEELFAINVLAPLWLASIAIPHIAEGGFIVNLSAVVADQPMPKMAAYSATKAALTAADRALARELRRDGIHVLDVRPPHTETGLARRPLAGTAPRLPTGAEPAHVARRVVEALEAGESELAADAI